MSQPLAWSFCREGTCLTNSGFASKALLNAVRASGERKSAPAPKSGVKNGKPGKLAPNAKLAPKTVATPSKTAGKPECVNGTFYVDSNRPDGPQIDKYFLDLMKDIDTKFRTLGPSEVEVTD